MTKLTKIKKIVEQNDFFCSIYEKGFSKIYRNYCKKKAGRKFRKHSLDLLQVFSDVMSRNHYNYFLVFGTLLGAIREKGFISHDFDIDVGMWSDDYTPDIRKRLEECGFKFVHAVTVDDGAFGREETYTYNGVHIDIFFFYTYDSTLSYCCDFVGHNHKNSWRDSLKLYGGVLPRQIFLPIQKSLVETDFNGLKMKVPKNYDEILRFRYGDDYMIPNPNWSWISSSCDHIVERPDKIGVVHEAD